MGRLRTFDRNKTLEKAMDYFQIHGYEAASLSGLLETMNISRGSFYQCFNSKENLFEECLDYYQNHHFTDIEALLNSSPSSLAFIQSFLEEMITPQGQEKWKNGCLLVNCVAESPYLPIQCQQKAQQGLERAKSIFAKVAQRTAQEGQLNDGITTDQLAAYLYNTAVGLRMQLRAGSSPKELQNTISLVLATLPIRKQAA